MNEAEQNDLYAPTLLARERAAARFRVFADAVDVPAGWRSDWAEVLNGRDPRAGEAWPSALAEGCRRELWPQHAFGTANAAVLLLWHRPGQAKGDVAPPTNRPHWLEPRTPVLGGIGHAHNHRFAPRFIPSNPSWRQLRGYMSRALSTFGLNDPFSMLMVACVNPEHGHTGVSDAQANRDGLRRGGAVDHIVEVIRPLLVLAAGGPVQRAIRETGWRPRYGVVHDVDHPSAWEGYGSGRYHGRDMIVPLFERWSATGQLSS